MKIYVIFLTFIYTSSLQKRKYNYDHQTIDIRENYDIYNRALNEEKCFFINNDCHKNKSSFDKPLDAGFKTKNTSLNKRSLNCNFLKNTIEYPQMDFTSDQILLNEPLDLRIKRPKIDSSSIKNTKNVSIENQGNKHYLSNESLKNNTFFCVSEIQKFERKDTKIDFISCQMTEIYEKIARYTRKFFNTPYFKHYTSKISNLTSIYKFLYENNHCYGHNNDIFKLLDPKLIEILKKMLLRFDKNAEFTEKNYLKFMNPLFLRRTYDY
ncbi:hypothetical protein NBO_18g0006 [Nosema bombycis CQ1]|uniref:Uncharacterized protein n=1 Tax=Nosema bombycis (strain CQ1 / CVCC 102059) TaxID=578461 RepID=R0M9M0_NOSB1|nr:hypothetical protein NBO_18g0006 [Nosema bombycis CQ1]|eukprot:EOB14679.1 hypothetical protein NBO_18g0006 [Nosema bombycis CQ1]